MAEALQSSPAIFAPSTKAQALLADSSDSEDNSVPVVHVQSNNEALQDSASSDDEVIFPSKIATRLIGHGQKNRQQEASVRSTTDINTPARSPASAELSPSPDSLAADHEDHSPRKRRRLLSRRSAEKSSPRARSMSNSPPRIGADKTVPEHDAVTSSDAPSGMSRFEALIQKKREERLAREAAEAAKRAAKEKELLEREDAIQSARRVRGSSPADDSEEEEDNSNVAKSARPTRKASKKAIEEMNRETQRISRNMQLAHQARTKKKISKDSLLARFGIQPVEEEQDLPEVRKQEDHAGPSSSSVNSGDEHEKALSTPPTSPMLVPEEPTILDKASTAAEVDTSDTYNDVPSLEQLMTDRAAIKTTQQIPVQEPLTTNQVVLASAFKPSLRSKITAFTAENESDDELEVVEAPGMKRKFVAFERLSARKTKERPSHLALRSLANLKVEDGTDHGPNTATMQISLRRLARLQARQERNEKLAEYRARNPYAQTEEERQDDQLQIEDAHDRFEKAKQEAVDIRKKEKLEAKQAGTFVKDELDNDDESDDEDDDYCSEHEDPDEILSGSSEDDETEGEGDAQDEDEEHPDVPLLDQNAATDSRLVHNQARPSDTTDPTEPLGEESKEQPKSPKTPAISRPVRRQRIVLDDEDEEEEEHENDQSKFTAPRSPVVSSARKTPHSIIRSARKIIPGLPDSDDLSIGLTQAFAATMADPDSQEALATQEPDSLSMVQGLPSPHIQPFSQLRRLSSIDMVSESVPASQTQPRDIDLGFPDSQAIPESPSVASYIGATQNPFDLTQDAGYRFSPFTGSRFSETPHKRPQSTMETIILHGAAESPTVQRRGKLQRGRIATTVDSDGEEQNSHPNVVKSAFQIMEQNKKQKSNAAAFRKDNSEAREAFDEAAEESDDEYAGIGGMDGEEFESEDEEDRAMIDHDANVGDGDEPGHAMFHADRERKKEEKEVSKMLHNVQTGAWRRKRAGDDLLDLSDEEGERLARRRRKQEEWKKMRDALMMDEGVNKFARDSKKAEAFLKSIEDREEFEADSEDEGDDQEIQEEQTQPEQHDDIKDQTIELSGVEESTQESSTLQSRRPLAVVPTSQLNVTSSTAQSRRDHLRHSTPANLTRVLSELLEPVDSQHNADLSDSESDSEPSHYTDLTRHIATAEADENEEEDMGDFIVDDENDELSDSSRQFKKPALPERAPFNERRTRPQERNGQVIDRLSLLRQSSSSTGSSSGSTASRMAFLTGKNTGSNPSSLLRRATTNSSVSSLGAMSGRGESVSSTGVTTTTERGSASVEKDFVRKGNGGRRNAVNFVAKRVSLAEERMSVRAGVKKTIMGTGKKGGFLGGLFRGDSWA